MVDESLLKKYKARLIKLQRGDMLFQQGELATHFYIVKSGKIKMMTYNNEGKEFVQGYFAEGESFGEPPFFNHIPYPASAMAVVDSSVWKCSYESFTKLLKAHFGIHLKLTEVLCGRLIYKSMMLSELAVEEAEHRLTTLIEYFKKTDKAHAGSSYKVPFTRQQLADMTGLRVETVIRSIKSMEQKGVLRLEKGGKIVWTTSHK